jgi:hypothetical protein
MLATEGLIEQPLWVRFGPPSALRWRLGATGVPQEADPIADKASDLFYRVECRCETARSGLPQFTRHGLGDALSAG